MTLDLATMTERSRSAGFTPGAKHIAPLLEELSQPELDAADVKSLGRALLRAGPAAVTDLSFALKSSVRPARGRLTEVAAKLAQATGDLSLRELLLSLLTDADLKTQLNAVTGLGRLQGHDTEQALLALLATQPRVEVQHAVVRALGKAGGAAAKLALAALPPPSGDKAAAGERLLGRAQLILQRELNRDLEGRVLGDLPLASLKAAAPRLLWLHCRRGLEQLLAAEAKAAGFAGVEVKEPGLVALAHAGALDELWRLRLFVHASIPLQAPGGEASDALVTMLASPKTQQLLAQLSSGPVRYRLDMPELSKSAVWALAARLRTSCPDLINDPTASLWELRLRAVGRGRYLELVPKRWNDPRFAYRRGYVPAASHPTLAAALARVAGVREDDLVWDPFVGSGTELIERARLGSAAALYGTDTDAEAIATARSNAAAAEVSLHLEQADALLWQGPKPTLTITNPPMGRRVQRGNLHTLFDALIPKLAAHLAPGGRLVWLSPLPARTVAGLRELGLTLAFQQRVDMGGFDAELQLWQKPN